MNIAYISNDAVGFLGLIFSFVVVLSVVSNRARERRERLRILEEQLRAGRLDAMAQQRALDELTGRSSGRTMRQAANPPQAGQPYSSRGRLMFGVGWLGLFLGIGLILTGGRDEVQGGLIVGALGLAFITLPIAIRELESDRRRRSV